MKQLILLGLMVLVTFLQGQIAPKVLQDPKLESKVDELVAQYQALDIYSGVVLVALKGNPVYHKAFGLADRENGIENTLNTKFDIGSMNKSFTKVLILNLVNDGKLTLTDNLGKYLTGFSQEASAKITIEHLLNHSSGYGDYHTPEYWDIPRDKKSLQTALEQIKKMPLLFEPGTEQAYSNAGYVLLGLIAEAVAGESYYDLIEKCIVKPLKMNDTYLREKYSVPNRSIGYYKTMRGELLNNDDFQEIPTPAGGFYSTTSDMLKFYREFHYGDLLWEEQTRSLDVMYPFYQEHMNTGGAITHAGGFEGANTVHYEILRDQISVVVFANMDEVVAENLGAGILAIIRGQQPKKPVLPAQQAVYKAFTSNGIGNVKKNWKELTINFHPDDPKDMILNSIGYEMLSEGQIDDAIEIFGLNTQLFPNIANCWDSYGEALLNKGRKKEALKAYKRALKIRPDLSSAKKAVKMLETE